MLVKRIIPCLDVREGRVVKGVQFVDIRDAGDPVEVAQVYDREGADELVFLDITASYERRKIIPRHRGPHRRASLHAIDRGGGVSSIEDMRNLLNSGADKVSVNTAAGEGAGAGRACSAAFWQPVHRRGHRCASCPGALRRVVSWTTLAGLYAWRAHPTGLDAVQWAVEMERLGAGRDSLTSMDRDGTQEGYDLELTRTYHLR